MPVVYFNITRIYEELFFIKIVTLSKYLLFYFRPEAAMEASFDVQAGDIILVGTDGLFDNMNEETILQHISKLKVSNNLH